jgi:DNA-binding GntR family transcriptional regulator
MIDPLSPTPLYVQLADLIAAQIKRGELKPRQPLPSETTLRQQYGVSRGTVRAAVRLLRDRGVIVTIRARGSYVAPKPAKPK